MKTKELWIEKKGFIIILKEYYVLTEILQLSKCTLYDNCKFRNTLNL